MVITVDTNYVIPEPQVRYETDQEYLEFVMSRAAESYMKQYGTNTKDEGIAAARAAYNASIPDPEPAPEVGE